MHNVSVGSSAGLLRLFKSGCLFRVKKKYGLNGIEWIASRGKKGMGTVNHSQASAGTAGPDVMPKSEKRAGKQGKESI